MKIISFKTAAYGSLGMFSVSLLTLTLAVAQSQDATTTKTVKPTATTPVATAREANTGMSTGRRAALPTAAGATTPAVPSGDAAEAKKHPDVVKFSNRQAATPAGLDGASKDAAKAKVSTLDGASKDAAKSAVKPQDLKTGMASGK